MNSICGTRDYDIFAIFVAYIFYFCYYAFRVGTVTFVASDLRNAQPANVLVGREVPRDFMRSYRPFRMTSQSLIKLSTSSEDWRKLS